MSEFLQFFRKKVFSLFYSLVRCNVISAKNELSDYQSGSFKTRPCGSFCDFFFTELHQFKLSTIFRRLWYSYAARCITRHLFIFTFDAYILVFTLMSRRLLRSVYNHSIWYRGVTSETETRRGEIGAEGSGSGQCWDSRRLREHSRACGVICRIVGTCFSPPSFILSVLSFLKKEKKKKEKEKN